MTGSDDRRTTVKGGAAIPVDRELLRHFIEEDGAVRACVRAVTRGHREEEDVIQDIWLVACRKIAQYDRSRPFRNWIMGITRMQLLKWRQRLARSREVLAPDVIALLADTAETHRAELDLRSRHLRYCLSLLTGHSREILLMKYYRGMKIAAIAARVRKSTAAIEMALVRIRRQLRACIEERLRAGGESLT